VIRLRRALPEVAAVGLIALLFSLLAVLGNAYLETRDELRRIRRDVVATAASALERAIRAEAAAKEAGVPDPGIVDRTLEAIRAGGLDPALVEEAVREAERRIEAPPGPRGPRGAPGPAGPPGTAASTTTARASPTSTSTTTRPPATTTSTTRGRPTTTTSTRPCVLEVLGLGVGCAAP